MGSSITRASRLARPALLLLLGFVVLGAALLPGLRAVEAYRAARALDRGAVCTHPASDCVRRVPIRLGSELGPGDDYPYPASTRTWVFRTADGAEVGTFDVSPGAARELARLPRSSVGGLFHGDHLLAVEAGGTRVETAYAGSQEALRSALFTLALAAVALLLGASAAGRRRSVGSWWGTADARPDYSGPIGATHAAGWTLLVMFGAGMVPYAFGGPTWLSLVLMAAALGGALVVTRGPVPAAA